MPQHGTEHTDSGGIDFSTIQPGEEEAGAIDFSPVSQGQVEQIEPEAAVEAFPTLKSFVGNERFGKLNEFRKAFTLGKYKNEFAQFLVDSGKVKSQEEFDQQMSRLNEAVLKHIPNPNNLSTAMQSFFGFNPGVEIVAEVSGMLATQRAAARGGDIRQSMRTLALQEAQLHDPGLADIPAVIPTQAQTSGFVERTDTLFKEFEAIRAGAEQVIEEDVERTGRAVIGGGGLNLTTVGTAANRMFADMAAAAGSSIVAGPAGPFAYYALAGVARSDRAQRLENEDRAISDRAARSLGVGVVSGSLEAIGFGYLTNGIRAKRLAELVKLSIPAAGQRIAGAALAEGSTELLQSYLETFGHNVEALDDFLVIMRDPETHKNALVEAGVGAILGAGVRGGVEGSSVAYKKIIQTDSYKKGLEKVQKLKKTLDISEQLKQPISDLNDIIIQGREQLGEVEEAAGEKQIRGEEALETVSEFEGRGEFTGIPEQEAAGLSEAEILKRSEALEQGEKPSESLRDIVSDEISLILEDQKIVEDNNLNNPSNLARYLFETGRYDEFVADVKRVSGDENIDADSIIGKAINRQFTEAERAAPLTEAKQEAVIEEAIIPAAVQPEEDVQPITQEQPSLDQLVQIEKVEQAREAAPQTFEEQADVLFFPDPDAKPEVQKAVREPVFSQSIPPKPSEAIPVPFNVDNDPELKKNVVRKVRSIAKIVEQELGIPVRKGKFRQQALGIFKVNGKVVRTKLANDLQIIAHEVGHALSDRFGLAENGNTEFDHELLELGKTTSPPEFTDRQRREEGRAEYMREFLVNPAGIAEKAPDFHAAFVEALRLDPETKAALDKVAAAYGDIVSQSAAERVEATIVTEESLKEKTPLSKRILASQIDLTDSKAALRVLTEDIYGKAEINILDDPYRLSRISAGAGSVASFFVKNGLFDSSGNKLSDGLAPIVKDLSKKERSEFDAYLKARRVAQDMIGRGLTSGVQESEAKAGIAELEAKHPTFRGRAAEVKGFTDALIEYSVRENLLTPDEATRILEKNTAYIPFVRAYDKTNTKATGSVANPFQMIKGDTQDTLSGIAALENNVNMTVRAAANMRVFKAVAKMGTVPGMGKFIEQVDSPGIDEPIISFVNDGKREFYRVKDELVHDALMESPPLAAVTAGSIAGAGISFAKGAARLLNRSAILTLAFIQKNLARDTIAAGIQSKNNFIPVYHSMVGLYHVLAKTDIYQKFNISGAPQSSFTQVLAEKGKGINHQKNMLDYLAMPLKILEDMAQVSEEATRLGDFQLTYNRLKSQGVSEAEAIALAGFESRDLTVDFQKSGKLLRKANSYVPFLNANIQGKAKTAKALQTKKGLIGTAMLVMAPELILWAFLKDDEDYKDQQDHVKDNFWLLPVRDNKSGEKFVKIPKPQGYSWFANQVRNSLDSLTGRDRALADGFAARLKDDLKDEAKSLWPALIKPVVEVWANHSFFRDQKIINPHIQKMRLEDQFNSHTSELAKKVGPLVGVSPIYFDHLVYGYTTNWGKFGTAVVDSAFLENLEAVPVPQPDLGRSNFAEMTGLKSFLGTNPNWGAKSVQTMFDLEEDLNGLKISLKNRDEAGKKLLIEDNQELWNKRHTIKSASSRIRTIGKKIQKIYEHETMAPERKKGELRKLFDQMLEVSRKALDKK